MAELPLLLLVATDRYPSAQKQSVERDAPSSEVMFIGHSLMIPVQHQNPGLHRSHGALPTPAYPGAQ